jgi:tetratricopeptide (TPR) repeat protein
LQIFIFEGGNVLKTKIIILVILCIALLVVLYFLVNPLKFSRNDYQQPVPPSAKPVASASTTPPLETARYPDNTLGKMQQLYDTEQEEKLKEFCMNILLTNPDEVIQWNEDLMSGKFKTGPAALLAIAGIYRGQNNIDSALTYFQQMVDKYPNEDVISFDWGTCKGVAGAEGLAGQIRIYLNERPNYQKAYQLIQKLKESHKGKGSVCVIDGGTENYLSMAWEFTREYLIKAKAPLALCESIYQAEMALTDDKSFLLFDFGCILSELGYKERAIAVFEEVVAKYPESWSCGGVGQLMCSFNGLDAYMKLIDIYKSTPDSAAKLTKAKQDMKELYNRLLIAVKKKNEYGEVPYQQLKMQEDGFKKYFQ